MDKINNTEEDKFSVMEYSNDAPTGKTGSFGGLTKNELMNALRLMVTSREFDIKSMNLLKQGKSFFHMAGAGHEAAQVACGLAMRPGIDWAFPYYRDTAFILTLGVKLKDLFLQHLAKADSYMSGGRQMPNHWSSKEFNIPAQSSPTGTQFLQAVGVAIANKKMKIDSVVYVSSGEGATSEGEFHEAVNWAARDKLPVVFLIENNKYAISVPVENQSAGKNSSIAEMMSGYETLFRQRIDGTQFLLMHAAAQSAFKYVRHGRGPALIEADVVRLFPHSSSDDQRKYRDHNELSDELKKCPINNFVDFLINKGILTELAYKEFKKEIINHLDEAAGWALDQPDPKPSTAKLYTYDESGMKNKLQYEKSAPSGKPIVMVDAVNHALLEEMERNEKIYIFGQDISDSKGGVFTATKGLSTKYGNERVFNAPLAEASIAGVAIGMSLAGLKPVIEIQFGDYIWPAFMQMRDEMVTYRYRSNNFWEAPVVTRVAIGGYIHGGLFHSQNIEGFFAHMPGILIAYPSNAADAKGLLKTAIRLNDPVLFLEHKGLYRQSYATSPEPDSDYLLPFGKAKIVKNGNELTVITYGATVYDSLFCANQLEKEDYSVEVVDIRTINPLDENLIYNSVKKTGKVIIIHEDTLTAGFGAEIAARISDNCFQYLDAPVKRLAAEDMPIPYHPLLEKAVLPTREKILSAIKELLEY
jgi:2-oxoisovalerate dehydrogenase E1 component